MREVLEMKDVIVAYVVTALAFQTLASKKLA